jgi:pSer/pThr/pTyr-binding forkhead associated (FHA) protein
MQGSQKGDRFSLQHFPFTIGRAADCDFMIDGPGISRLHVQVECSFGRYFLTDENSTNGTFVNEQRVVGKVFLNDGDLIRLASATVLRFDDPASTDQVNIQSLDLGGIQIDEARREVYIRGEHLEPPLPPSQYALLALLIRRAEQVVTRDEIASAVWPDEINITDQMIDTLTSRLRRRLAEYGASHYIVTRRGFGLMYSRN